MYFPCPELKPGSQINSLKSASKQAEMSKAKLQQLSPVQQRKAAAILGALVADSATSPLHWIYDQEEVKRITSTGTIAFVPEPHCPYYHIPTGTNSAYGAQVFVTLREVATNKGVFEAGRLADALYKECGPGTIYEKVRQESGQPKKGPWTNHNLKIFIANREEGRKPEADPTSQDPDGLCKAIVVIASLSGTASVLDKVGECVGTTQSNEAATNYARSGGALLDSIIQTGEIDFEAAKKAASPNVLAALEEGLAAKGKPHQVAAKEFGLACGFPASFKGMIQGIASATSFPQAVKDGILAGGDNCSRNTFIGACVAAKYGLESFPDEWLKKYDFTDQVIDWICTVVKA
ncbi:crystallin J1C-like [Halichondria panicea]|uniref:crystallin J1C-like n=1 Tax=Halichondria panicea TaxID=6063 RepID=UPI00312B5886